MLNIYASTELFMAVVSVFYVPQTLCVCVCTCTHASMSECVCVCASVRMRASACL